MLQDWFRHDVHVQHRDPRRPQLVGDRELPREPGRVLRAVLRDVRGDGPDARHPGSRRRRIHAGRAERRRRVRGARPQRPRVAGGVVRRVRLGAVRADPGPGHARRRGVHRASTRSRTPASSPTTPRPRRPPRCRRPPPRSPARRHRHPARPRRRWPRRRPRRRRSTSTTRSARGSRGCSSLAASRSWRCWSRCPSSCGAGADAGTGRSPIRCTRCSSCGTGRSAPWERWGSAATRRRPRSRCPTGPRPSSPASPRRSTSSPSWRPRRRSPRATTSRRSPPPAGAPPTTTARTTGAQTIESVAEESLGLRDRIRRYFTVWH